MSDALKRLIEAVEAGTATGGDDAIAVPMDKSALIVAAIGDDDERWSNLVAAHDGDLNAAKALHDALLPGWRIFSLRNALVGSGYTVVIQNRGLGHRDALRADAVAEDPARAWLIAILKAYQQVQLPDAIGSKGE